MDSCIDLDPAEQRRRVAAEKLNMIRDSFESFFEGEIETARDQGLWDGDLKDAEKLAAKMANAAMRQFLPNATLPVFTWPVYFDLKDPQ